MFRGTTGNHRAATVSQEMSRGQRPSGHCPRAVETGLGGRRWDRTSGGKVGSSSQTWVALSDPSCVSRAAGDRGVASAWAGDSSGTDQTDGHHRGPTTRQSCARSWSLFPHLVDRGPTEWPASGSLSAGSARREPAGASQNCIARTCSWMVLDRPATGHARFWVIAASWDLWGASDSAKPAVQNPRCIKVDSRQPPDASDRCRAREARRRPRGRNCGPSSPPVQTRNDGPHPAGWGPSVAVATRWRRRRDLNPRWGLNPNPLSRRAP